jgi:hypothetical protein
MQKYRATRLEHLFGVGGSVATTHFSGLVQRDLQKTCAYFFMFENNIRKQDYSAKKPNEQRKKERKCD